MTAYVPKLVGMGTVTLWGSTAGEKCCLVSYKTPAPGAAVSLPGYALQLIRALKAAEPTKYAKHRLTRQGPTHRSLFNSAKQGLEGKGSRWPAGACLRRGPVGLPWASLVSWARGGGFPWTLNADPCPSPRPGDSNDRLPSAASVPVPPGSQSWPHTPTAWLHVPTWRSCSPVPTLPRWAPYLQPCR